MHLFFMTRGVSHQMELFKTFMQAQMFPWKRVNLETGKEEMVFVQGALRPVQLWEYVFPEEHLDEVLTMMHIDDYMHLYGESRKDRFKLGVLRKMLGGSILPVPEFQKVPTHRYIETGSIAIYPIGIKKDEKTDFKHEWKNGQKVNHHQEML